MFDGPIKAEYKNISAPDELRQRVLNIDCKKSKNYFKTNFNQISLLAACLVFVIVCSVVFGIYNNSVVFSADEVSSVALARQGEKNIVRITVISNGSINIESKDENIFIENENGYFEPIKAEYKTEKNAVIGWEVSEKEGHITVNGKDYSICYSETDGKIIVAKK